MVAKPYAFAPSGLAYWKAKLADAAFILELPTDRPRPASLSGNTGTSFFTLDASVSYLDALAAFYTLIYRYTGEEDFLVGIPDRKNWLVLRGSLTGDMPFSHLLDFLNKTLKEVEEYGGTPLLPLLDELNIQAESSRHPLIQVAFDFTDTPPEVKEDSTLDLQLTIWWDGGHLGGQFTYSADLFREETIQRMADHYLNLLRGAVENPQETLAFLPLLSPAERDHLLVGLNNTAVDFPLDTCVHHLFEAQVSRTPNAAAVISGQVTLTYEELNRRANQLAHHLKTLGVGPDSLVGLCMERSIDMLVGMLGILKAGGAYVPMDPAYPPDRLAFMVEDTRMPVLLTQQRLREGLELDSYSTQVLCVDTAGELLTSYSEENPQTDVQADNVVYVIYTSGSTGKPKGVLVPHRGLVNHNLAIVEMYGLKPDERAYQFISISFDASVEEIFPTLISGATLVLRQSVQAPSIADFIREIEAYQVNVVNVPTAYWHEWIHMIDEADMPASVRLVIIGGERAAPEMLARWRQKYGLEVTLINGYGPTETTIASTYYTIPPGRDWSGEVSIGRPFANTTTYIVDKTMQPVPIGVPGELYIGGVGVTRGYLNRPDLTAERFLPDPFRPEGRMYKTGDLCRYLPDGNIEFLGRADFQVKVRGYRIELGEIEAALAQHPAVIQSVVVVREDEPNHKRIVAYNLVRQQPTATELRQFLKERLPEYMVPAAFVTLDSYPLTPTGKINRRALPAPAAAGPETEVEYVAPRTPAEVQLAALWKDILKLHHVGVYDDFFELGGHSLLATRLVSLVRREWEIELPLSSIFEKRTIAGLAELLDAGRSDLTVIPVERVSRETLLPQAFAQQRVWFVHELNPTESAYNIAQAFHFEGALNLAALHQTLNELVRRHEALRTTLDMVDGQPAQVIHAPAALEMPVVDTDEQTLAALVKAEGAVPFDLAREFPIRAKLFRVNPEKHTLVLTIHHAVFDGSSSNILAQEMAVLYAAFAEGKPSPLPDVDYQYADFAVWQQKWLDSPDYEKQLAYWQARLSDHMIAEMPTDNPRPPVQTMNGAYHPVALPQDVADALVALSQREGTTLYMTVLAALQTLMFRYTGSDDIRVGTAIANRPRSEFEPMVGMFVNTLVLRTDLSGSPTFRETLKRVREVALGAYAHQDLPFDRLVDVLRPERDRSRTPLFQVLLVWEDHPVESLKFAGVNMHAHVIDNGTAKFDLSLYLYDHDGRVDGFFEYNTDLFQPDTIERMSNHLQMLLRSAAEQPDQRLEELRLLTDDEEVRLLIDWNQTQANYPADLGVHHVIEAQVERTPDKIAAIFENQQMTYRELNRRANQLAHTLIRYGVGADMLVGLCVDRSLDMLVGLLGILKSGAGYVPIDPTFPADRVAYMLEDAQANVLVTQSSLLETLPPHQGQLICLDTDWPVIQQEKDTNPNAPFAPSNLAYTIYTSGSTGKPKGVQLQHQGVVNFLNAMRKQPGLTENDVLLAVTTISFDIAVLELYLPLMVGGQVVIASREVAIDGLALMQKIEKHGVTVLQATPATFRLLMEAGWQGNPTLKALVGGEPLPRALANQMCERTAEVWNMYGPTETTVWSTVQKVEKREGFISIGRPIDNTQIYILDKLMQPVPIGVSGELYIGGDGVARGYLNRAELTAEKFLPNPFMEGGRIYRTGDLARYIADGTMQFFGRADHQIKLRGYRIELGEIETVLAQHPSVRQNVVIVREDTPGNPRLVAYLVTDGHTPDAGEWRTYLREKLPDYMIPSAFIALEALPLTPNGKIDRKALPAPDSSLFAEDKTYVAPRTEVEEKIAAIWGAVLGLERVSVQDSFFELGGHSLLAMRIFAGIEKEFGKRLPLTTLFTTPTVEGLAELLPTADHRAKVVGVPPVLAIQEKGSLHPFFCVGGGVLNLKNLSRYVGNDLPFYVLQSESLNGYQAVHAPLSEIASFFLKAIKEIQPNGPYYLGGAYGSGIVALEMARQLEVEGEEVALLALFNTRPNRETQARSLTKRIVGRLTRIRELTEISWQHFQEALQDRMWKTAVKVCKRARLPLPNFLRGDHYEELLVRRAGKSYLPEKPFGKKATLFYTYDWYARQFDLPKWGWGTMLAGELETREVPGIPCDMFIDPYVQVLAMHFKDHLEQAKQATKWGPG